MSACHRETLTSRERVVRTLNRQPIDRLPIDLGSHFSTGISAFAYWRLREHLGLSTANIWVPDVVQMLAHVDDDILQRFHCDCTLLYPRWSAEQRWNPYGPFHFGMPATMPLQRTLDGGWLVQQGERQMRMPSGGHFFDGDWISDWCAEDADTFLAVTAREAERIYKETPYATNYMGYGAYFGGIDEGVRMLTEPEQVHAEHEAELAANLAHVGRVIDAMGQYIQLITINADMGLQTGPMCRPSRMAEFTMPYIARFCDFVHRNSDCKVFLHCCGSIRSLIGMLAQAGVDALNPVQISADNMDARDLKRDHGDEIVFWGGGCDTQRVLGIASPDEVRANVRGLIGAFKPNGGFVFCQVHNVLANVPPENVVAMLDEAHSASWCDATTL